MVKSVKEIIKKNHKKFIATLTYAEPDLTEEDYMYLIDIIFETKNVKNKKY